LLALLGAHHILHVSGLRVNVYWFQLGRKVDNCPPFMTWTSTTLPLLSVKSCMMFLLEKAGRMREMVNSDVNELENVNGRDHLVDPNVDGK